MYGQSNRSGIKPGSDRSDGKGPFKRMVIIGATLINVNGSPPVGPVDIVIEAEDLNKVILKLMHQVIMFYQDLSTCTYMQGVHRKPLIRTMYISYG